MVVVVVVVAVAVAVVQKAVGECLSYCMCIGLHIGEKQMEVLLGRTVAVVHIRLQWAG